MNFNGTITSMTRPTKILVLSANPKTTPRLRLDEEIREIEDGLMRAKQRENFDIKARLAVRYEDLRRILLDYKPQVVHFIGHGDKEGLTAEDKLGNAVRISPAALSGLFKLCSHHIDCVILNTCYSAAQADAVNRHIDYVVCMRDKITDKAAITFAIGFYDAMAAGEPVTGAFEFGCNAIQQMFPDFPAHLIPLLKERKGLKKPDYVNRTLITGKKQEMVNIRVLAETTGEIFDVRVSLDTMTAVVKSRLIDELNLLKTFENGIPIPYDLVNKTRNQLMDEVKTLRENGIRGDEVFSFMFNGINDQEYRYDVFLSFSGYDNSLAKPLWKKLRQSGLNVFFFEENLKRSIGHSFFDAIESALEQSRSFILFCTPNSMNSVWVQEEYKTFYCEFYLNAKNERLFIILEEEGFKVELLPKMLKNLQRAKSVSEITGILSKKRDISKAKGKTEIKHNKKPAESPEVRDGNREKSKKNLKPFLFIMLIVSIAVLMIFVMEKADNDSGELYISNLSFMDGGTMSNLSHERLRESIDSAILDGLNRAREFNNSGLYYKMSDESESTEKLIQIIFSLDLPKEEKIDKIIDELMTPNKIDVIISGFYLENSPSPLITVSPFLIIKDSRKVLSMNFQFLKSELFTISPVNEKKAVCEEAYNQIFQAVLKDLGQFKSENICIKSLPFMDMKSLSAMTNEEESELLHRIILRCISETKNERKFRINSTNHFITNSKENVNDLVNIMCDPNITGGEKIESIINTIMNPGDVDLLVSGQYIEDFRYSSITIRVFIILRDSREIVSRSLQFKRFELFYSGHPRGKSILRSNANNVIAGTVEKMLVNL